MSIKVFFFLISNVLKVMDVLEYISFSNGKSCCNKRWNFFKDSLAVYFT